MKTCFFPFIRFAGLLAILLSSLFGKDISPDSLLLLLSDPATSRQGIDIVKASEAKYIPILLKWTIKEPRSDAAIIGIYKVSLADAFGELKVKEAIPFLLKYIGMDRDRPRAYTISSNIRYQAALKNKPAMTALIKIGEVEPLLNAYYRSAMTLDERDKLFTVICEIADKNSSFELSHFLSERKIDLTDSVAKIDRALKMIETLHTTK